MLKKLFCMKHDYKFYNIYRKFRFMGYGSKYIYQFICIKCGKVKNIDGDDLEYDLEHIKRDMALKEFLGKADDYEVKILQIRNCYTGYLNTYKGKYVDYVLRKYLKKGIDLEEIDT